MKNKIQFSIYFFFYVHICMCVCVQAPATCGTGAQRGRKRMLDPLELEVIMNLLDVGAGD